MQISHCKMIKAVFDQHQDSNQLTSDLDLLALDVNLPYGFFSSLSEWSLVAQVVSNCPLEGYLIAVAGNIP